jgi:acetyl-CoA acetyltransferase
MPNQPKGAIVGLGVTPMGKIYGRRAVDFAAEAIALALDDAGLNKSDVDGLLINANLPGDMDVRSQMVLGFENLTLVNVMSAYGSTAGSMMQYACLAIRESLANVVVLVYADAPLSPTRGAGQSYAGPHRFPLVGMNGLRAAYGNFGANPEYAMAARRHMHLYGTTTEQFGAIAVGQRKWAQLSPWAQMRKPMTLEDHHASRFIAEPLRLLDCCLVSNGAVAVIVTSAERARNQKQPPVNVLGYAQCAPGDNLRTDRHPAWKPARNGPGRSRFAWPASPATTSAPASFTTAIPTRCWSRWRITASARKARAVRSLRTAGSVRAGRCRRIPAAGSCRAITCGASRRCRRRWCRRAGRAARDRCHATIMSWSARMVGY